mmetsp:Transcript_1624/g.3066  ORF Transcript_1624/g.3066 Transcript_1624/m.3066 type:complete len:104 (-) Transcript_1624:224-535(-)
MDILLGTARRHPSVHHRLQCRRCHQKPRLGFGEMLSGGASGAIRLDTGRRTVRNETPMRIPLRATSVVKLVTMRRIAMCVIDADSAGTRQRNARTLDELDPYL